MQSTTRRVVLKGLGAALILSQGGYAVAKDYPTKPIEFVIPTSPGSSSAQWGQLLAEVLGKPDYLGVPVRLVLKAAGSGNEAAVYIAQRPADGYTLLQSSATYAGSMNMPTFVPDPKEFEPLVKVERFLYMIAVPSDSEFKSFADLVTYAKANPGKLGIGGNKIGSTHHRHIADLFKAAGVEVNHIPYEGSGEAVRDLVGKHIPAAIATPGQWKPHLDAGSVRMLVLLNDKPLPAMPDVPTVRDLGYTYEISHHFIGVFVKRGTPDDRRAVLIAAFKKFVESPEYATYLSRNPHVVPTFESDKAALDKDWAAQLESARAFLRANQII